eukprot:sb/3478742/
MRETYHQLKSTSIFGKAGLTGSTINRIESGFTSLLQRVPGSFRRLCKETNFYSVRQLLGAASYNNSTFTKIRPVAELFIVDPNNARRYPNSLISLNKLS